MRPGAVPRLCWLLMVVADEAGHRGVVSHRPAGRLRPNMHSFGLWKKTRAPAETNI